MHACGASANMCRGRHALPADWQALQSVLESH
jgi:hypothetical protein